MKQSQQGRNRDEVIKRVFEKNHKPGATQVPFTIKDIREAIAVVANLNPSYIEANVPDVRYEYTSGRRTLPHSIDRFGPWMISSRGKGKYVFEKLATRPEIQIPADLAIIFLPDATPEIVLEYAGSDEQGVLAMVHYNRLLDVFLQITCYHLQNHWRTTVIGKGQREIDDMYVGLDTKGRQYVIPVEAKSRKDRLSVDRLTAMVDARGNRTTFTLDNAGRVTQITYPPPAVGQSNPVELFQYNCCFLTKQTDANNNEMQYYYDALGRMTKCTQVLDMSTSYQTEYGFDAAGKVISAKDPRGNTTNYEYDAAGRLTKVLYPAPDVGQSRPFETFAYDRAGNRTKVVDRRSVITKYEYDALHRPVKVDVITP